MNDIIKQGYLYKQSLVLKQFRKRWIALKGTYLHCYNSTNKETDTIDLTKYNHIRSTKTVGQFEIISDHKKIKKRVFTAESKTVMYSWIEVIQGVMIANQYNLNLLNPTTSAAKQFERSQSTSKILSHETSDNEFQNICKSPQSLLDYSESNTDRNLLSESLQREYSRTDDIFDANDECNDAVCRLKNIPESQLLKVLKTNEIIFDSLMSVYSSSKQMFIDIAAVLVRNYLYLISPINYEIWQEFRDKTKIDELLTKDSDRITQQIAVTMANNLDIIDDISKITPSLKGQTKKEIKLNLLLNQKKIVSLSSFFQLDEFDEFGEDIPGTRYDNQIRFTNSNAKVVWIQKFKEIIPYRHTLTDFILKSKTKCDTLICRLDSNNNRYAWLTHLDFVNNVRIRNCSNCTDEFKSEQKTKDKLIQDFTHQNVQHFNDSIMFDGQNTEQKREGLSNSFSFGEYLEYWRSGYKNSVRPKYATLKEELLKNKIERISEEHYYWLYKECVQLSKTCFCNVKAQNIGVTNKQCQITVGTVITINHLITLKVYTDFSQVQRKFKKNCRKLKENETIQELVRRNAEIGHWSRLLKESVMFYGTIMKKAVLYTGLKTMLTFSSMKQNFECPLSTTTCLNTAQNYCDDNGIILKLKAANSKARYFDVSRLSCYNHEKERLVMGSSLQIYDIYIDTKSTKEYISALHMLEEIIDGQFILNTSKSTEETLFQILSFLLNAQAPMPPKYITLLFNSMIKRMRKQNDFGSLWINKHSLDNIKHKQLQCLFVGHEFFKFYNINLSKMNWVQQFEWVICGDEYKEFVNTDQERLYIKSVGYEYSIDGFKKVGLHFECCSKYRLSDRGSKKITLFFCLDMLPIDIEAVRVECSLLCQYGGKVKYHEVIPPQWLSKEKTHCGGQTFSSKTLNKNTSITSLSWIIAIKLVEIRYVRSNRNMNINILPHSLDIDEQSILDKLKVLMERNAQLSLENVQLRSANMQKDDRLGQLQVEIAHMKRSNESESSAPPTPTTVLSNSNSNRISNL